MRYWIIVVLMVAGCNKAMPEVKTPERMPIYEQAEELSQLPEHKGPTSEGQVVSIEKGEEAPINGLLFSDEKAFAVADLRISYDEIYRLAIADRKYLLAVVKIQEQELMRGDKIIQGKELELKRIRDSWWQQNKLTVGIVTGAVVGLAVAFGAGKIWSAIDESAIDEEQ